MNSRNETLLTVNNKSEKGFNQYLNGGSYIHLLSLLPPLNQKQSALSKKTSEKTPVT